MQTKVKKPAPVSGLVGPGFRKEIQGLRAIAVLLVVIFHIWPAALPGGYVGVDVFFVISGYLITGLLLREIEREGRVSMTRFYARRIRRLLPAATVVLLAVAAASFVLMPETYWSQTASEIFASAFYFENWLLAYQAADYFEADAAASPVQHFWSLSVEEQFYIVWPWALLLAGAAATRVKQSRVFGVALLVGFAVLGSLGYSVWLTNQHPEFAYFATTGRAWELGLGAGLVLALRSWQPERGLAQWMGWAGLAAILVSAAFFSTSTAFPGYAALLPTGGALLVLASGEARGRFSSYRLLELRPFQFVGDISYSLYLWHWPLIVFYGYWGEGVVSLHEGLGLALGSVALAFMSKRLVEDPFHGAPLDVSRMWKPYLLGASCLAICAAAVVTLYCAAIPGRSSPGFESAGAPADTYHGAAALDPSYEHRFVPSLPEARKDIPSVYRTCHGGFAATEPKPCTFGEMSASRKIALVGDSHAGHWSPALFELATSLDAVIYIYTKSACPFTSAEIFKEGRPYSECNLWNRRLLQELIELRPDLVISSASAGIAVRNGTGGKGLDAAVAGQSC